MFFIKIRLVRTTASPTKPLFARRPRLNQGICVLGSGAMLERLNAECKEHGSSSAGLLFFLGDQSKGGAGPKPTPFVALCARPFRNYILVPEHLLVAASHMPPALSQSAEIRKTARDGGVSE